MLNNVNTTIINGAIIMETIKCILANRESGRFHYNSEILNGIRFNLKSLKLKEGGMAFGKNDLALYEELNSGYELNVVHTTKEELETITSKVDTMQRKKNIAKAYRMMIEQR